MDGDQTLNFSPSEVSADLNSLEAEYEAFYTAIDNMDKAVAEVLQVADESALLGTRAGKLLENWTTYCNPYKSYYNTFRSWSSSILAAAEKYNEWEAKHQGEGKEAATIGEITRTLNPSTDGMSFEDMRKLAALQQGATTLDGKPIIDPRGNGKVTIGGETYTVTTDADGKITKITDSKGGEVSVNNTNIDDSKIVQKWNEVGYDSNSTEWTNYINGLSPEEQKYATAIASGAKVTTADTVVNEPKNANDKYMVESASLPEGRKSINECTDDELRAMGKTNYEQAKVVQQKIVEDGQKVDNAETYYLTAIRPQLVEQANGDPNSEAGRLVQEWDQKFESCTMAYDDAYWDLDGDNHNGIVDGDMVDIATWQSRDGWAGAYQRQQAAIERLNANAENLQGDEFLADYYDTFGSYFLD